MRVPRPADWDPARGPAHRRPGRLAIAVPAVLMAAALMAAGVVALVRHAPGAAAAQTSQINAHPPRTVVSLTFDDAYLDQWRYAVPLLRAHHMHGTFYVITADSDVPYACCMSWAQLRILQAEGDDIGSHTVDHPNLTRISAARVAREVCGSRRDMLSHGIRDPRSFAYPFGSYNTGSEKIVRRCGFTISRQGGGISSSSSTPGPPWAETLPPRDSGAVRTIAPDGANPIRLPDLERFVTQAAAHGGGWLPITFHNVCDAYAADYLHCMSSYGPILDAALGQFLDWLHRAGRPGGAPAGVVVLTMRQAATR